MPKRKALSKDEVDDLINDLRKARARREPDVAKPGEFILAAPSKTKDVRQSTSPSADMVASKSWPHMPFTAALADNGERPFSIVVSDALQIQVPSVMGALQSDAIADALSRGDSLLQIPDASISAAALTQVHAHLYGRDIACASFQDAVDLLRAAQTLRMQFLSTAALGSVRLFTKPENALEAHNWIRRFGTGEELEQCRVYVVRNLDAVSRTEQWCRLSWTEIEAWVHEARAASTPTAQILHCFLRWICNTSRKIEKEEVSSLLCALPVSSTDRPRLTFIFAKLYQAIQNSPKIVERLALVEKCMERTTTSWSFLVDVALRQNRKLLLTSKLWKPIQTLSVPLLGLSLITHEHSFFTFGGMQESQGPADAAAFPRVQSRDLFPALAHRTPWPISSGSMSLDPRLRPTWPSQARKQDAGYHRLVSSQRQDLRIVDAATTVAQHHFGIVAGGCDAETGQTLASVSAFILDTKEWVSLPPLPRPRVAACAGWLCLQRNRSYVLVITAGCDETGHADASTLGLEFTCTIEDSKAVWSWATEWKSCSALAEARFAAGTCVIAQDTMVVVGGLASNASETLASVEILRVSEHVKSFEDLALVKWAKSKPLPAPLHSMGVFGISGSDEQCRVVVAGGRNASGKDLADVLQFCLEADSAFDWQRMPLELPECRSSFGYTIVDAGAELCLLVAGGVSGSRVLDSVIALVLDFRTTITTTTTTTTTTPKEY